MVFCQESGAGCVGIHKSAVKNIGVFDRTFFIRKILFSEINRFFGIIAGYLFFILILFPEIIK
ncbi:hypothetical protein FXB78_02090 [Aggregatibacter actinomycetemcomitans]|nr:hypothetical protein FXN58_06260 [Aggregatibacter actinomycetemcomitans]QEH47936.1 hypothetical protein FXN59_10555 [Aggregatibacter actinomycetemcomitans]QEH49865.1 hypothetical protein FXN57_09790 [Aggregatibacter actinomycetemcomitans]TYA49218.1 hypothetical protein FXB74_05290 [Aggregatibacter actinomycetemcomitans]TYA51725.1 hypothetical protein FXB81_02105 [Aggregatibacter actinomycetemcomitans]